ncbi:2-hydroxychromene-2-carboxylate isomerase family protein [hydrothermal vent metagenome]|uniref:2-hydroxychromene-2-carboxylate isomerase family protein n=1 Tax=hydrothermal vent metagenome TaxID=652676 RepID=A0A3B0SAU2_9ZZZZ
MAEIEYFYSAHSAFAYIGAQALRDICQRRGCRLVHRPVDLDPVIRAANGGVDRYRSPLHHAYFFGLEIERWAKFRDVPIIDFRPTYHDNPLALPNGMIIAAEKLGADVDGLSQAILTAHWRDNANITDKGRLIKIAQTAEIDPGPLLEIALSEDIQQQHRENTEEAIARGVFGSPTYFYGGEMFYGQDRLAFLDRTCAGE